MAFIDSYYAFDQRLIDINQLVRFGYDAALLDNQNFQYRGITYQDVLEVDWYDGVNDYASVFGGRGIEVDASGAIVGGTVTGYLELFWNGVDYEIGFGIEKISVSAVRIYQVADTRSTFDDSRLIADLLSGDDRFSLSHDGDFANGFTGRDTLTGLGGRDTLVGGAGDDRLFGGGGADRLSGGGADDYLVGGGDNDRLTGNAGGDRLSGSAGRDTLAGGGGDDRLNGGGGDDRLNGGGGGDRLVGANGDDTLKGGFGRDTFVFDARDGSDRIVGFQQGQDHLAFRGADDMRDLDIRQQGAATVIEFGATAVLLTGQDADDFSAADFLF